SWGFGFSIVIECAQLFVKTQYTKISDVVLATTAAALGAIIYVLMFNSENRVSPRESPLALRASRWFAIAGIYAAIISIIYTAPFEWLQNEARIAKRWHNLWNIPFGYSKYWSDPLDALT